MLSVQWPIWNKTELDSGLSNMQNYWWLLNLQGLLQQCLEWLKQQQKQNWIKQKFINKGKDK